MKCPECGSTKINDADCEICDSDDCNDHGFLDGVMECGDCGIQCEAVDFEVTE